ncbi:putative chromosome segregation protein (Pcs1) [Aspergillus undulatus]|uniref:putative chromosome segregation protein (Pcs1) n=1 Tax=Aspergillus undulatus TaxID=1810928 RepID=UPI003CCD08F2
MPKRKATTKLSGLIGSDDDVMQTGADRAQHDDERPAKKARGRPRSKSAEMRAIAENAVPETQGVEPVTRRGTRRGRPKGSRNSGQMVQDTTENDEKSAQEQVAHETDGGDEPDAPGNKAPPAKSTKVTRGGGAARGRRKASTQKQLENVGEFQYTPTGSRQQKVTEKPEKRPEPANRKRQKSVTAASESVHEPEPEPEPTVQEVVEETIIQEEAPEPVSVSLTKRRQSAVRHSTSSPLKRKLLGEDEKSGSEPELRRRLGDLTKKYDTLENRYRNLKDIGIVEANANMEKLKKQCESMTAASNDLIESLKAELEAQKALGQKSRSLQKDLRERDAEVAKLTSDAEESASQLAAAQSEVKALQTKLAAARNTAATLEQTVVKAPGSAIKGGANRATAVANAEAAQAAQFAQLKEDLYSDLTGLIIRDVKKRETDSLYDCIQTGVNGTLHFKLVVPHVSSANFETAEFQYIPLLDENRDRDLVDILPEYLTVDITFVRQQASKFYTRVIDALTKRRASQGN